MIVSALTLSHLYRTIILKRKWLNLAIDKTVLVVLISSVFFSLALIGVNQLVNNIFDEQELTVQAFLAGFVVYFVITIIWNVIYFAYHFFDKSRKQEVKTLQLESTQKESELLNLKNQLKPHFMFNAMNSIRALVDDDPELAKQSITQLSNLLRNTLQFGKKKLITLKEELQIVNDYLALEKIRFEERLEYQQNVDDTLLQTALPPLLIQTLVENAIKHGISKKTEGGIVSLAITKAEDGMLIHIKNVGEYNPSNGTNSGIGLDNAKKRLQIIYGSKAEFSIGNHEGKVLTRVKIPLSTKY
jgi:LytS/YehU family sensor histidine kinase